MPNYKHHTQQFSMPHIYMPATGMMPADLYASYPLYTSASTNRIAHSKVPSMFSGSLLEAKHIAPTPIQRQHDYWISGIIFIILILITWMRTRSVRALKHMFGFVRSYKSYSQFREDYNLTGGVSIALMVIYVLSISLFIYQLIMHNNWYKPGNNGLILYLKISAFILLIYLVKAVFLKILGFIFNAEYQVNEYIFNVFLLNETSGLLLFPIVISIAYIRVIPVSVFFYFGSFLIAIVLLYRVFRGVLLNLNEGKISKFYLFLYLCTLEILPLIVLIKFFMSYI